jgi:malate dehydrogenase (oxaloacetate-decarboxylating)
MKRQSPSYSTTMRLRYRDVPGQLGRIASAILAAGRSDFANQINNVLCFPGFFRGIFDVRACRVTPGMRIAAAQAIAQVIADRVRPGYIVPSVFDRRVAPAVARAVSHAAMEDGVARRAHKPGFRIAP